MLDGLGIDTGVSLRGVVAASTFIASHVPVDLPSRYLRAEQAVSRRSLRDSHDA
jgi:hypothetical protein